MIRSIALAYHKPQKVFERSEDESEQSPEETLRDMTVWAHEVKKQLGKSRG